MIYKLDLNKAVFKKQNKTKHDFAERRVCFLSFFEAQISLSISEAKIGGLSIALLQTVAIEVRGLRSL